MSWARLDDKFPRHAKIQALSDREFRVHVEAICYCAEYRTEGRVPRSVWKALRVTPKIAARFVELGLWDVNGTGPDGDLEIHDFEVYNPVDKTAAERQRKHRAKPEEPAPAWDDEP